MQHPHLPITALPAWSKLNDVKFLDIEVQDLKTKGFGLLTCRALSSGDASDVTTLMTVPRDLVLSSEAVDEYAKVDAHLRELLDAAGGKSIRGDIMLFLLMQITIASMHHGQNVGTSNPWTEYVRMLPEDIPVPTLWDDDGRMLLLGTSLEAIEQTAVASKIASLVRELEDLHEKTSTISWCQKCWWESDALNPRDWFLIDAWYRSRCLEIPDVGEAMIPCIDMVNHSFEANAYYELTSDNNISLLLRPGVELDSQSEITISYGSAKPEAEMLFSYGFSDKESTSKGLTLPVETLPGDPLGKAKVVAFPGPPVLRISQGEAGFEWYCPFMYLMCLNEEDGLDFKVLQQTDGVTSPLRVFWQDSDVTDIADEFEFLISSHELKDVFKLRVVALLLERIQEQVDCLSGSNDTINSVPFLGGYSQSIQSECISLRCSELSILDATFKALEEERDQLLKNEVVLRYLGSMDDEDIPEQQQTNEEDDFS